MSRALAASALLFAATAHAQIYVAPGGVDTGDGRDPSNPVATIAYAISQATEGESIRLAVGTYTESVAIADSRTILGDWPANSAIRNDPVDPSRTVLQPDGSDRVILFQTANPTDALLLDGLTITGGDAGASAVQPGDGGGVCSLGGGTLSVVNCVVSGNAGRSAFDMANNRGGGRGGGIYAERALMIFDSSVTGNVATSGDESFSGGSGGGIYYTFDLADEPQFQIEGTTVGDNIAQNTLTMAGFGTGDGFGGGIAIVGVDTSPAPTGRAVIAPTSEFTIRDAIIEANSARGFNADEGIGNGGGLAMLMTDSVLNGPTVGMRIEDSRIEANFASESTSGLTLIGAGARGGGIYDEGPNIATITNTAIINNIAEARGGLSFGSGGGLTADGLRQLVIVDSTISGNTAAEEVFEGFGGGMELNNTPLDLQRTVINGNTASKDPFAFGPPPKADGGGIHFRSTTTPPAAAKIVNNVFSRNTTSNSNQAVQEGGGLWFDANPTATATLNHNSFNDPSQTVVTVRWRDLQGTAYNNIFVGGLNAFDLDTITLDQDFNLFNGQAGGPIVSTDSTVTGGANNVTDPPVFVNEPANDLRLQDGSPGIDQGTVLAPPVLEDIVGNERPTGMAPDIGAHEFVVPLDMFDFGDAPDSYGTLLASDGARHVQNGNTIFLGGFADAEGDGQPDFFADGDDKNPPAALDDEDGVNLSSLVQECIGADIIYLSEGLGSGVEILSTGPQRFLFGWFDLNADGAFDNATEKFADGLILTEAAQMVLIAVPPGIDRAPMRYARFRIGSTQFGVPPTGAQPDGEVEDYPVLITRKIPFGIFGGFTDTSLEPGQSATIAMTVQNDDPLQTAHRVIVRLSLLRVLESMTVDSGLNLVTIDDFMATEGAVSLDQNEIVWSLGDLAALQSATINIDFTVLNPASGLLRVRADTICSQDQTMAGNGLESVLVRDAAILANGDPGGTMEILEVVLGQRSPDPVYDTNNDGNVDIADYIRFKNTE